MLLEANRRFGLRTSGLQFLFWFFLLICGIPQLRTQIRERHMRQAINAEDPYSEYFFTSYLIFYVFSLAIFILNCYADGEPRQTKYPKSDKPYPELGASFLSRLVYAWFDPLAWKGYRKPLEQVRTFLFFFFIFFFFPICFIFMLLIIFCLFHNFVID